MWKGSTLASEPGQGGVAGTWHPPASSRAVFAHLSVDAAGRVSVRDADKNELSAAMLAEVSVSDRVAAIPRRFSFADGSIFETGDNDAVDRALKPFRWRGSGFVHELERFHPRLALFVVLVVLFSIGLYRYAVPALVEVAVIATPPVVPRLLSQSAMISLDRTLLGESKLEEGARREVSEGFAALAALSPRGAGGYNLNFRDGGPVGPNAFALPDGTIVLTDELVRMAGEDRDAVLAVLAHEIGHVEHEHSLRQIYRAVGITSLIMMIGGDIGAGAEDLLVQGAALASLSHSRGAEREADRYSVELMHRAGRDPAAIARFFELLRERFGDVGESDFLSTHPATPQRIEETRRYAEEIAKAAAPGG